MIDINSLPVTAEEVDVTWDNYQDPQEFSAVLLPEGVLTFRTTKCEVDKFDESTPDKPIKDKDGNVIPWVVTFVATHEAFDDQGNSLGSLSFDRFTTKPFNRNGARASMAADQLRAYGETQRPASPRAWADAMLAHANGDDAATWKGAVKWDAYCGHKDTPHEVSNGSGGYSLKGARNFTPDGKATCPVCQKQIEARSKVDRRIPRA